MRARSIASLYDMQGEHPEAMTFRTAEGDRAGMSFIQPKSIDELRKRTAMFRRWAEYSHGMMGRTPDYLNASLAAMASAHEFFSASDPRFGANIANYYGEARKHDWCATHTLLNPHTSRAAGWAGHTDADLALKLVDKSGEGIVVSGCRMLATLGTNRSRWRLRSIATPRDSSSSAAIRLTRDDRISTRRSPRASRRWIAS